MSSIEEAIAGIVAYAFDEVEVPGGISAEREKMTADFKALANAILLQAQMNAAELLVANVHGSSLIKHPAPPPFFLNDQGDGG